MSAKEGSMSVEQPVPAPDLSEFPSVQHRIEGGRFVCPGDENAWCHRYPGDECEHEYWPCGHEFVGHAECWAAPWITATDLCDSYSGKEYEHLLLDEDFPDGDVTWHWEDEYVTFDYGTDPAVSEQTTKREIRSHDDA